MKKRCFCFYLQRRPLLHDRPSDLDGPESARQTRSAHSGSVHRLSLKPARFPMYSITDGFETRLICVCLLFHPDAPAVRRIGRLVVRRVGVQEVDQRFTDMAETFNEQQQRHEAMVRHIRNVRQLYGCNHNDALTLAECLGKIREEHGK